MSKNPVSEFYQSSHVVQNYENGRIQRVFIKNLPEVLHHNVITDSHIEVPLYSFFDWIYNTRVRSLTSNVLYGSILDVACGTSYFYRSLMQDEWIGTVTGYDISQTMIDEGTQRLMELSRDEEITATQNGNFYYYLDGLGRKIIDIYPPVFCVHKDSVLHLLENRFVLGVEDLPSKRFSTITAFSGPLCYFPIQQQEQLFYTMLSRAEKYLSIQFKNSAFHIMNCSPNIIKKIAGVIRYIFDNEILDSFAFLEAIDYKIEIIENGDSYKQTNHEVGQFPYHLSSVDILNKWIQNSDFLPIGIGTMGFTSETFYNLVKEYYEEMSAEPRNLLRFFNILYGIDNYFCSKLKLGDNLHITIARKNHVNFPDSEYSFVTTYRGNYYVKGN